MRSFFLRLMAFVLLPFFILPPAAGASKPPEQNHWIIFGAPQDSAESRISPSGAFQPFPHLFTITPLIEIGGQWFSGKQADRAVYYKEGHLPIPKAVLGFPDFRLEVDAFAWGPPERSAAFVSYRIINKRARLLQGKIHFLIQPAAENVLQALEFSEEGQSVRVNGLQSIFLSKLPEAAGFLKRSQGNLIRKIKRKEMTQIQSLTDPEGSLSGALSYVFKIKESKSAIYQMTIPLHSDGSHAEKISFSRESLVRTSHQLMRSSPEGLRHKRIKEFVSLDNLVRPIKMEGAQLWPQTQAAKAIFSSINLIDEKTGLEARTFWRAKLNPTGIWTAEAALDDEVRLKLASLWVMRDHPGFYPDDYRKTEAWTADTLKVLRTFLDYGFFEDAREDLEIIALRTDLSGGILSRMKKGEAPDLVREYALQGKFVIAVWDYYRALGDKTWLTAKWPLLKMALEYLKRLREQRLTDWYASGNPERKRFYGILPPSTDPSLGDFELRHRYEDDVLAIEAFEAGQKIAKVIGLSSEAEWLNGQEQSLRRALLASVELNASLGNVRFIPAVAETPDLISSPKNSVFLPQGERAYFSASRRDYHFQNIKDIFKKTKISDKEKAALFSDFPVIQAFLRRGDKALAHEMFRFERARLIDGDISKTTGFLQTFRSFFVYESGSKLILGAGILPEWTEGRKGLRVKLPTSFGEISYTLHRTEKGWRVHAEGNARPPEGFTFHAPSGNARKIFQRLPADFEIPEA